MILDRTGSANLGLTNNDVSAFREVYVFGDVSKNKDGCLHFKRRLLNLFSDVFLTGEWNSYENALSIVFFIHQITYTLPVLTAWNTIISQYNNWN